jgi:ABC-type uncharacterized transport system fused permease/ATPase subunit
VLRFLLPARISAEFTKDIYGVAISVLSIIVSVYFAALAIILSSGDNEFIKFLEEEEKLYTSLITTFKFTLTAIFSTLVLSIVLYGFTSYKLPDKGYLQHRSIFIAFASAFSYSLVSVILSVIDAMQYSKYRSKFIEYTTNKRPE